MYTLNTTHKNMEDYTPQHKISSPFQIQNMEKYKSIFVKKEGTDELCEEPDCIYVGFCLCRPPENICEPPRLEHTQQYKETRICPCKSHDSGTNMFPSYFRNEMKKESLKIITDERMQQEFEEIKQLVRKHQQAPVQLKSSNYEYSISKLSTNKSVSITNSNISTSMPSPVVQENTRKSSPLHNSSRKSRAKKSVWSMPDDSIMNIESPKTEPNFSRKKKKPKSKHLTRLLTTTRKFSTKAKPLRIRYYYSGGTEHYGVKLGHKHCLSTPPLVPHDMGWLWNIENPSKGIRERKGWPPGFIGKSIKKMIQQFEARPSIHTSVPHIEKKTVSKHGGKIQENNEEKEQKKRDHPLIHIIKKGRLYNITFCPKNSDEDVGPVPIPITIKQDKLSTSSSSDSTLEFELHSPKPREITDPHSIKPLEALPFHKQGKTSIPDSKGSLSELTSKETKKKIKKKASKGLEENKVLWEDQETQIQNVE